MSNVLTEEDYRISVKDRPFSALYARNARAVISRGLRATKSSNWMVMVSGFFEPVLYLISMGVGLGALVAAGVTVVTTANNHAMDFGPDALEEQRAILSQVGIAAAGSGASLPLRPGSSSAPGAAPGRPDNPPPGNATVTVRFCGG